MPRTELFVWLLEEKDDTEYLVVLDLGGMQAVAADFTEEAAQAIRPLLDGIEDPMKLVRFVRAETLAEGES